MASKGPKGTGKPAAPKAPVRPKVESKPKVAAVAVEKKPVPVAVEAPMVPFVSPEPVAAVEAAPQVVEVLAEAPVVTVEAVVEAAEAAVEAVQPEAPAPAIETVTEAVETVVPAALKEDKIMETIETNVAKAQAFFADFNDRTKAAVEKSTKLAEEANEFAKGNLEAVVESGKITAAGLQSFGQDAADYSRKSFEAATAALKSMSAVKSPTELFKLQSDFFRTSFDSYVAEASKTTEALIKLAGDAAQPLSSRVALAAEKAKLAA
ncbi:phasin family protein [Sphingomonas sp. G-3-2-10]|uniref:phasin family protein n=1 Tax=Sphingomonas sp. G-3-2-10 TaxID=2728838 RepID=UPI001469E07A|nr:phasin family protein [Sphingomonas sp. G-3-2-10]NML07076.1 TIGR01841 family phasin [Sphingomonas sp. G-3-2-10]